MPETNYRPATASDTEGVAAVMAAVLSGPQPVGFERALDASQVETWMMRLGETGALYVAEEDGSVIAFAALDFNTQEPETGTLGAWVVDEHRGRGVATALAERLLEHAREHGFNRIVGRLPEDNEAALSFLSSIGGLVPIINPEMRFELPL